MLPIPSALFAALVVAPRSRLTIPWWIGVFTLFTVV
jgi:hypothetical protein